MFRYAFTMRRKFRKTSARDNLLTVYTLWAFAMLNVVLSVVVQEVRLLSQSNKSQYVIEGETASLMCLFLLGPGEELKRVIWSKDGTEVYVWRRGRRPLARNLFENRVDLNNKSPSYIQILNSHQSMQGNYTCRVETDNATSQNDFYLTVVVDACKESSWSTFSDRQQCTEEVTLDCQGMFPKPSPACGIYNEATGTYLNTVPFDRVDHANGTYSIYLRRIFKIKDWIEYRNISFRCHVIVLGTDWRNGISHKLFGDPGCLAEPPEVVNGFYNVTGKQTCWGTPDDGAVVEYLCIDGFRRRGPEKVICKNGTWLTVSPRTGLLVRTQISHVYCEANGALNLLAAISTLVPLLVLLSTATSSSSL